jgi:hypothetical protein
VAVGEYMREGTAMFRLVALDPIKFRADVPERFSAAVQKGMAASVTVAAFAQPFTGRITRIAPDGKAQLLCRLEGESIWALQCDRAGNLYAANDFGFLLLAAGETSWVEAAFGMPNVEVAGLTIVPGERILYAATHGLSAWRLNLG